MSATERQAFYERIAPANLAPLWEQLHSLVTAEPMTSCVPALWRYDEVRPHLMQAGELITAQEAQRRVLILENPGLKGQATITGSLFAGLQLILPGEVAPAHRHTQSALRFIIEGHGAYTAVDGERTAMQPGDFVITPSWTWHDHGNDTQEPMVWLDGLDIQIVKLLSASFAEQAPAEVQAVTRPEGDSAARFANNLVPVDWRPAVKTSPVFNYPNPRTPEPPEPLGSTGPAFKSARLWGAGLPGRAPARGRQWPGREAVAPPRSPNTPCPSIGGPPFRRRPSSTSPMRAPAKRSKP